MEREKKDGGTSFYYKGLGHTKSSEHEHLRITRSRRFCRGGDADAARCRSSCSERWRGGWWVVGRWRGWGRSVARNPTHASCQAAAPPPAFVPQHRQHRGLYPRALAQLPRVQQGALVQATRMMGIALAQSRPHERHRSISAMAAPAGPRDSSTWLPSSHSTPQRHHTTTHRASPNSGAPDSASTAHTSA